jgi:hypothetical protein
MTAKNLPLGCNDRQRQRKRAILPKRHLQDKLVGTCLNKRHRRLSPTAHPKLTDSSVWGCVVRDCSVQSNWITYTLLNGIDVWVKEKSGLAVDAHSKNNEHHCSCETAIVLAELQKRQEMTKDQKIPLQVLASSHCKIDSV